jgi:mycothiol synthase
VVFFNVTSSNDPSPDHLSTLLRDLPALVTLINMAAETDNTARTDANALRSEIALYPDHNAVVRDASGMPIGFALFPPRGTGLTFEFWVHPLARSHGVAERLFAALELHVRRTSRVPVTVMARAYSDILGIETLYQRLGFTLVRRFYLMSTRLGGRVFTIDTPQGITLRSFRAEDLESLVDADNSIFEGHFGSAARDVQSWRVNMVESRPHDPKLWTLAWYDNRIVGECLCHQSLMGVPNDGWVSIVGVQRDWRGRGLGRAILAAGLNKLQDEGYQSASLHVDAENTAAVNLYRSLEMNVTRTRLHFSRQVG